MTTRSLPSLLRAGVLGIVPTGSEGTVRQLGLHFRCALVTRESDTRESSIGAE